LNIHSNFFALMQYPLMQVSS